MQMKMHEYLVFKELRDLADILNVGASRAGSPHIRIHESGRSLVSDVMSINKPANMAASKWIFARYLTIKIILVKFRWNITFKY